VAIANRAPQRHHQTDWIKMRAEMRF
jgi:hypothetical protein